MNTVYKAIVESQLRAFAREFADTARDVFYSPERGTLIHPGEFGMHRESVVRSLLVNSLPSSFGVSQGFVLAPTGEISTQCDIVIFDKQYTPIIRNSEDQRFFPVESVVAVGEVKSRVKSGQLLEVCRKLAATKRLRRNLTNAAQARSAISGDARYAPDRYVVDQICSFLVAVEIELSRERVLEEIAASHDGDDFESGVNLVLDVSRGRCVTYSDGRGVPWPYPVDACPITKRVIPKLLPLHLEEEKTGNLAHMKLFLYYLQLTVTRAAVLFPDLRGYWGWE